MISSDRPPDWVYKKTVDGWHGPSQWIGERLAWTTPCALTLARIIALPIVVAIFYFQTPIWMKFAIMTPHLLLDWWDGALARYFQNPLHPENESRMSFGARLRWPGETQLGKILDPIADKGTFYSVLLPGGLNFLPGWLVYINFLLAIALTVSRPVLRFLYQAEVAANWFGKRKIWFEVLTISSLALLPRDRIGFYCGTAMLAIATALAALSLAAQLWRALRPSSSS